MLKNELNISLNKMRGHFMSFNDKIVISLKVLKISDKKK